MAVQPRSFNLFHGVRPWAVQGNMDALVSHLWQRLFPAQHCGPNLRLSNIFERLSHCPELATLYLCPFYFDQVTYSLPTRDQVKHTESCNLRLHCFDSWASLQHERRRATERHGRRQPGAHRDARPSNGIYLSRVLQDVHAGRSLTTKQYIEMMYGHRC